MGVEARTLGTAGTRKLKGFSVVVLLLVVWQLSVITGLIVTPAWPGPTTILATGWHALLDGQLLGNLWITLARMFVGFLGAAFVGVGLGLAMGFSSFVYDLLEPVTELLRPIPAPAYIPVVILFLGLGESMKIFVVGFASLFPILINTYDGVRGIDTVLLDTARTFRLSPLATVRRVILPGALPHIFTGLRVSLAISLIVVVVAEMVASSSGIGYFVLQAERDFEIPTMYAGIFLLGIVGYLLNTLFLLMERAVLPWHYHG